MRFKVLTSPYAVLEPKVGVLRTIYNTLGRIYERPVDSRFPYKNRIRRARDMQSLYTVAKVGASLAGCAVAAAALVAAANAR
jgi:hypothetical protein